MESNQELERLIIRRMDVTDIDSVMHVEQKANSHGWRRRTFVDSLQLHHECWVVVEPHTSTYTIAHSVLGCEVDSAELYNISVDPAYQGRGIGRLLLNHMLLRSRTMPVDRVFLEVRVSNERAISLYQSVGFKRVGVRRDYYQHDQWGREDAYVFALRQFISEDESSVAFDEAVSADQDHFNPDRLP